MMINQMYLTSAFGVSWYHSVFEAETQHHLKETELVRQHTEAGVLNLNKRGLLEDTWTRVGQC